MISLGAAGSLRCLGDLRNSLAGTRLFITGGTGFLGRALIATLLEANRKHDLRLSITLLSRDPARFARNSSTLAADGALSLVRGDVRSFRFPDGDFTHVVHAAADTSAAGESEPAELTSMIVDGCERVLEFARQRGAGRFLFLSSGVVYGPQPVGLERIAETYDAAPADHFGSTYGRAKRLAEALCWQYHEQHSFETIIARCFSFVGPYMLFDGHFAIANFIADAVAGRAVRIAGDGTPVRSYLDSDDAATWLLRILSAGRAGSVYNVGSDVPITIRDLAQRVAARISTAKGFHVEGASNAPGAGHRYVPDVTRARTELGLDVWTDLDEAIRRTAEWFSAERALCRA